jgi:hypothetical protein
MPTATINDCTQLDSTLLERVNYFPRQLLTADDMITDQQYFIAKMRRHNRYLHGWGVVCGLLVIVAPTAQSPWQVVISPGYALGPYGDEIYVPNPVTLDLAQCGPGAATDPCDPGSLLTTGVAKTGAVIYVAIRYEECFARPVKVLPGGCGCSDSGCEPSRISDSYEIECLSDLPPSAQVPPQGPSMCDILNGRAVAQCPPCPTDPWVVLAQVKLPGTLGTILAQSAVDNSTVRRKIFSTAVIQQQVQLCCCAGSDRAPARVTSINPANNTVFTNNQQIPGSIIITFNKHLVAASVNTNTILVLLTQPNLPSKSVTGTVSYDDGTQSATFTPNQPFTIPGTYQVTVVGSGPSFITDSDGLALDGNADGTPGGNFLSQFSVQVTQPTGTPTTTPTPTPSPTPQPTYAPPPVNVTMTATTVPNLPRSNRNAQTADLLLTVTGGTAGQKINATVTVLLSLNLGAAAANDTAVWSTSAGASVNASKSGNAYTFSGVSIIAPGAGAPFQIKIVNMKVDASLAPAGNNNIDVQASVNITSTTPGDPTLVPVPNPIVVARVLAG